MVLCFGLFGGVLATAEQYLESESLSCFSQGHSNEKLAVHNKLGGDTAEPRGHSTTQGFMFPAQSWRKEEEQPELWHFSS